MKISKGEVFYYLLSTHLKVNSHTHDSWIKGNKQSIEISATTCFTILSYYCNAMPITSYILIGLMVYLCNLMFNVSSILKNWLKFAIYFLSFYIVNDKILIDFSTAWNRRFLPQTCCLRVYSLSCYCDEWWCELHFCEEKS